MHHEHKSFNTRTTKNIRLIIWISNRRLSRYTEIILVFPCAGFRSEKGFQWDVENLGLGLPCAPHPKKVYLRDNI